MREREKDLYKGDSLMGCLLHAAGQGIKPATQVHVVNWELNLGHFSLQTDTLTTEQIRPGQH